jgi:hypothetical protein
VTDAHELLPQGGSVRALAGVVEGSLVVRVWVCRPAPVTPASRFSGSVLLRSSCGGAFWSIFRGFPVYVPGSPDLLPGEAFHLAASLLDRKLATGYVSTPPRAPLSDGEKDLIASLPGVLKGVSHTALLVMLS